MSGQSVQLTAILFLDKLEQVFVHTLSLVLYKLTTTLLTESTQENDRRSYFTKVWGRAGIELATPGSAVKHAPSQTRYRLCYAARCHCLVSLKIRGHRIHGVVLPWGVGGIAFNGAF